MALFVPILRVLMLFLNVYDSYKTLKPPLPSSRNPSRPSIRGMTQRKRDMKGCLSVWIVWVSLAMYERVLENFISLFIPFYDEFKSLVLLFLIVTRARGAEPIYLHLIRPIIKPYTRTLDAILEVMLMVGDFLIALSSYPIQLAMQWWKRKFDHFYEPSTSEDSSSDSSNGVNTTEVSSSFFVSSRRPQITRKSSNEIFSQQRRSSITQSDRQSTDPGKNPSTSRKNSRNQSLPTVDDIGGLSTSKPMSSQYQVWYPPIASYADETTGATEVDRTLRPLAVSVNVQEQLTVIAEQHTDEWRRYPAFPSAYPPTPIATTSKLIPTSVALSPSLYPPIQEESQQDFHKSLLPPREPLNPSPAGDLSDKQFAFGISPFLASQLSNVNDADDNMSTDGYENEDEDDFNVTLRTPLHLQGSARSRPHPRLFVSQPSRSASSNVSVPSRSSALSTVDNGSPLRTDTVSDSSLSAPALDPTPDSIVGKKRSYPRSRPSGAQNRVRQVEGVPPDQDSSHLSSSSNERQSSQPDSQGLTLERLASVSASDPDDIADPITSSGESNVYGNDQEQIHPEEKRRKVIRSPPARVVKPSRPRRSRTPRYASPPRIRTRTAQSQQKKQGTIRHHLEAPVSPAKRRSRRLKAGNKLQAITTLHELAQTNDAYLSTGSSAAEGKGKSDTPNVAPPAKITSMRRK